MPMQSGRMEFFVDITEQFILMVSPNTAATNNGKGISKKNGFSSRLISSDGSLLWGDCKGSGKTPYHTSIDFIDEANPVFRCSCPSRQIPCKHSLGLMFDRLANKTFEEADIPTEIADKRASKEQRAEKKKEQADQPKKVNKAAQAKKLKKQLEGLDLADKMVHDLLGAGLNTLAGRTVKTYEDLAKELGNYYLPGPQLFISRIVMEMKAIQTDPEAAALHYQNAIDILIQLASTIKKARVYLSEKLESEDISAEGTILFEAMGGIWKLEDLKALGCCKENVRLIQLSFDSCMDDARKELVDRAYWMDLQSGEVSQTINYRPLKALKYVKEDDSNFDVLSIPTLAFYPGDLNKRIRFEESTLAPATPEVFSLIRSFAVADVPTAAKLLKNQIKNTLSPKFAAMLVPFAKIGKIENEFVLEDASGQRLLLRDYAAQPHIQTTARLALLPNPALLHNNVLFGQLYYSNAEKRILMQPLSIITADKIIRLQY